MVRSIRLAVLVLVVASAAAPAAAASKVLGNITVFGTVTLGCAIDYSNPYETRFIISNTSGGVVAKGSRIRWTTQSSARSFILPQPIAVAGVYSFGLNAKGSECSVTATPPQLVKAAD
jgi:hypothetical protein